MFFFVFLGTILTATIGSKKGQEPYKPYVADAVAGKNFATDQEKKWDENYAVLTGKDADRSQKLADVLRVNVGKYTPRPLSTDKVK